MAAAIRLSQQHSCSLPDASRASDRKDSTPRHGRLLHPSSWAERDDRDHAADNFFQGGSPKTGHPTSAPATSLTTRNRFTPRFRGWGLDENLKPKSPPYRGVHYRGSAARQNEVGSRLAHPPRRLHPALPSRCAPCSRSSLYGCAKKVHNLYSRRRAGRVYPHEIDIQETHLKHRKLDSQAAIPHPTRDRAADGLRPKAWPLWASRRDHDPGGLSPWPAGLRGVRPAMAADRAIRGPLARSPCQEWHSLCASN